ncbi:hypothetical protein [Saccharopolyspora griseoalba]|uniref:Muconolactone isomerase domain-containing protein n=1 Tax=Saccharopolyspora griseoalba TaxID=1431848 RepID=A0ABW2LPZ6_9PSEU
MRMLLKVSIDTEKGNQAFRDGTLPKVMQWAREQLNPEAAFFSPTDGVRTAYFVFDMQETSHIPSIVEPFFEKLGAHVELTPAMDFSDVQAGVQRAGETMKNFQ